MEYTFLTGNYAASQEKSLYRFRFDTDRMRLEEQGAYVGAVNPSYILADSDRKLLYTVEEKVPNGGIAVYAMPEDGGYRKLVSCPSGGADPCHLALDDAKQFLFVSNYTSGSLMMYRLNEQGLPVQIADYKPREGHGPNPYRQECAHVHFSVLRGDTLMGCDLGMDEVFCYHLNRQQGRLEAMPSKTISVPKGCGPRHLAFHDSHPEMLYLIAELGGAVFVYRLEEDAYRQVQVLSTLPKDYFGYNFSAAIRFSQDGHYLFASNRGHDSVAVFAAGQDGLLEPIDIAPTGGEWPRDLYPFGNEIVCANQASEDLTVLHFDPKAGKLEYPGLCQKVNKPVCIQPL